MLAKLKQRFDAAIRNRSCIGQRPIREPVNVTLFGRKNVPHQIADGLEAAITVRPNGAGQNDVALLAEPLIPLSALPVSIFDELVQANISGHCPLQMGGRSRLANGSVPPQRGPNQLLAKILRRAPKVSTV